MSTDNVILQMQNDRGLNPIVNEYLEQVTSKESINYYDFLEYAGLTKNITFNNPGIDNDEITAVLQDQYWENNLEIEDLFVTE